MQQTCRFFSVGVEQEWLLALNSNSCPLVGDLNPATNVQQSKQSIPNVIKFTEQISIIILVTMAV